MRTDIDKRTAALSVFIKENAPCRNLSSSECGSLRIVDITKRAAFNLFLEIKSVRTVTALVADRELFARSLSGIKHLLCFSRIDRHRLFAHNVLACFKSGNRNLAVPTVGSKNVNDIYRFVLEKLSVVLIDIGVLCSVFFLCLFGSFNDYIAESNHFNVFKLFNLIIQ